MAGVCTISRDQHGEIQEVYAPNTRPSILYRDILESLNDKEKALRVWARAYTPSFKNKFGNWELVSQALSFLDKVGGVYKEMFKQNPQQVLYEVSVQAHSSKAERAEAVKTFTPEIVEIATELFPEAKVGKPYKPAIPKGLDENGEPLATYVLNDKEKQQFTRIEVAPETKGMTPIAMAERLSKKMGIEFEFDSNMEKLATIRDGKVVINPNNMAVDTVLHEFSHPFVEAIRISNPSLYKNLSQRAGKFTYQGQSIEDFVKQKYPDLKPGSDEYISELITTAIGLEGAVPGSVNDGNERGKFTQWMKTIMKKIADYINSLVKDPTKIIDPEKLDVNMTIADLADLMKLENEVNLDVLKGVDITADQRASQTQQSWGSKETIDFFENKQANIKLEESGDISYYTNGSIDPITNTLRKFTRLTDFTRVSFYNSNKKYNNIDEYYNDLTKDEFAKQQASEKDKISYGDNTEPQTFEQVKEQIKKSFEESRYRGKIMHKMIEGYLKFKDPAHFSKEIEEFRVAGGISEYDLLWFDEKRIQRMLEQIGLNTDEFNNTDIDFRDNMASELMMVNEKLGIGTSNDGFIEHSDKTVSFVDYKTGSKFLADENTTRKMQNNDGLTNPVYDSKLDRAKIELVMRMIVAKMNKPDLKVRDLKIAYISRYYGSQIRNVNVQQFLDYINNNYRIEIQHLQRQVSGKAQLQTTAEEAKRLLDKKKQEYQAMKAAGVFDFHNYQGEAKIFSENSDLETITDPNKKIEYLKNKVAEESRQSLIKDNENRVSRDSLKKIKEALFAVLNSVKSSNISDVKTEGASKDISWFASKMLGLRDQTNEFLKSISALYEGSVDKANRRINELLGEQSEFRKADRELHKEHKERTGQKIVKTFSYSQGNVQVPVKDQGIFDFMYTWKNIAGENVRVGAVYTEQGNLTNAQWKYYQESKKVLKEVYEKVRTKTAYINQYGKAVTYGEEYKKAGGYNFEAFTDSFLPTVPFQNVEEIIEKNVQTKQLNPAKITKEFLLNYKDRYEMSILNENRFNIGMPLKYMSQNFLENDDHSFNVTYAVDVFSRSMINKYELDDVYDIGMATVAAMSDPTDADLKDAKGRLKLENSIFALESFLNQHIKGERRKTLSYWGKKNEVANKRTDLFLDNIKSFIAKNAFWFAPVTATANGLYNLITNGKEAAIGSLSKRFFGEENAITTSVMAKAFYIAGGHQVEQLTKQSNLKRQVAENYEGEYYRNKVNYMMKMFRLSNKNYSYADHSLMLDVHNRTFTGDNAYVAQGLGEDLSNEAFVIAKLLAQKVAVKSVDSEGKEVTKYYKKDGTYTTNPNDKDIQNMWDAYELNESTGEFEYNGPVRFQTKEGEVKGITTLEAVRTKAFLERMYGAYSPEQKTHLERYGLGRMVMMFRKFWIVNIRENFTMDGYNKYVGEYQQLFEADGVTPKLKDGQPIYEWREELMQARVKVLGSLLASFVGMKNGKAWADMTVDQKKQAVRLMAQLAFLGLAIAIGMGGMIPPEDKDKLYAKRLVRLTEDLSAIHPLDLLRGTTTIDSYPEQLYKAANATLTFMNSVATDDKVQQGPYKGDYKGWNTVEDFIPVYHATNQAQKLVAGE